MNSSIPVRLANLAQVLVLLCLAIAVGSCTDDDLIVTPTSKVAVRVDVTPDSTIFAWDLAGPGGYLQAGRGDTVLVGLAEGEYELTWDAVEGFDTPDPASETLSAAGGDTITFTGSPSGPRRWSSSVSSASRRSARA